MEKPKKYKITIKMNPEDNKTQVLKKAFNDIKWQIAEQETKEFLREQIDPLDQVMIDNIDKAHEQTK